VGSYAQYRITILRRLSYVSISLLSIFLWPGCATIIQGTTQEIPVSSDPPGVKLTVDSKSNFTTPTVLVLSRNEPHILEFSLDGHHPEVVRLRPAFSTVTAGNIILGGLIGWGVDSASGAQSRLVPTAVHISLRPMTAESSQ
jgi:hypothetical protein